MIRRLLPFAFVLPCATTVLPPASAQSEPPPIVATSSVPKAPIASPERLAADLRWLTSFPTRHTLSAQNVDVARALRDRFREIGYEDVTLEEFPVARTTRFNVVATKRGTSKPEEIVLLGAHFDSRNKDDDDARGPAPGADDNGTGTVAVLEVARRLASVPTARTVRFVLFSGEEQGLIGAKAYAEKLEAAGTNVVLMMNLDMVGHSSPPGPEGDAPEPNFPAITAAPDAVGARRSIYVESDQGLSTPANDAASREWGDRLEQIVYRYGLGVSRGKLYGTDYLPFEKAGYAAVGLYDGADTEPFYHNADDLPSVVDADYHARAASAALELVALAAGVQPAVDGE
ncbi:M28 family metallopeptidase [Alienimonas chondri]|uniref:Peptidase M28 domain-containing protein n=1 Tax=Alienimonas chondri TaxID=2681879 RepID=A0ABX1VBQ0_9PLAN|nr:M20/M25/M40 family metallo-hydrolase [Alienimonas chondri]NNJ24935.1 hypothetical protein [Alienimonas chondri]